MPKTEFANAESPKAAFLARLQARLDARQDPLDDPELCEFLAEHPEQLEAFAKLRQHLQNVPRMPLLAPPAQAGGWRGRRWPQRWPLAILAASAAIVTTVWCWPEPPPLAAKTRGVLSATLETSPSRASAAISFAVRERWQTSPDTILETYELRSQIR